VRRAAVSEQEQVRFDVLASLGNGEPSMILPCGLLPWSGHSTRSAAGETSRRLAALQERRTTASLFIPSSCNCKESLGAVGSLP
jgi:hypothetical protein